MRILQLCKKFPFPVRDGEAVAVRSISKGLAENGATMHLLAFNTSKHFVQVESEGDKMSHYKTVDSIFLDNTIDPIKMIMNLFSRKSYNIQRFEDERFALKLRKLLWAYRFDLIQLESLYMVPYIPLIRKHSRAKIAMRSHNLEFEIWQNLADGTRNPFKRWYFNIAANRLKRVELTSFSHYDTLVPISISDFSKYQMLGYKGHYNVSPVGLDAARYHDQANEPDEKADSLGYIGSLDWKPNIEGINWFLENVWPILRQEFDGVEFHLAGRNAGQNIEGQLPDGVHYHGEVSNALNFLQKLDIVIVPLFSGSGIRVKILESMAMGKVVISTPKGFEGIDIRHGEHAFIATSPEEIITIVRQCRERPALIKEVGQNAAAFIRENFGYRKIAARLLQHYRQISKIQTER